MSPSSGRVLVVGSINVDLVVAAPRLPGPGETVVGGEFAVHHGGKGANQAVAAARAGAIVRLVAAVGEDGFGTDALAALAAEQLDLGGIRRVPGPTGVALIAVDASGQNQIAVAPGANAALAPADVEELDLVGVDCLVTGLEVPMPTVSAALARAAAAGVATILNVAPAEPLGDELLRRGAILVLNDAELVASTGRVGSGALAALAGRSSGPIVVTHGAAGATMTDVTGSVDVPGIPTAEVVDTTGAGDALIGAMAAWLANGATLHEAVRAGVAAGSLSVGVAGAREGMATEAEIRGLLDRPPRH